MSLKPIMYKEHHFFSQKLAEKRLQYLVRTISKLIPKPESVLDIGCGDGTLLVNISTEQKVGVDLNTPYAERMKNANVMFVKADATHLPFKSETFDLIIASEVLEHLDDPNSCVRCVKEALKIRGHFLVSVPNDYMCVLGMLCLLRFKSIQRVLRGHKHHNMASKLRSSLGPPIIDHSLVFNQFLLWDKERILAV